MSCSCRLVPWRTFVRGLAQVHRLDALKPAPLSLVSRGGEGGSGDGGGIPWAALRQVRGLHASLGRGQEAAAAPRVSENRDDGGNGAVTAARPVADTDIAATPDAQGRSVETYEGKGGRTAETKEGKGGRTAETNEGKERKQRKERKERKERTETAGDAAWQYKRERPGAQKGRPDLKMAEGMSKPRHQPYKPGATPTFRGKKWASDAETNQQQQQQQQQRQRQQQQEQQDYQQHEKKPAEAWRIQKAALKEKFPEGWKPRKRLSPDALAGIRALNAQFPEAYTTESLAAKFRVPAEAIRRILKSKWAPSAAEEQEREDRWFRRGKQVWEHRAALGVKPPKRWRMEGVVRDPGYHEWSRKVARREREWEEGEIAKYRGEIERRNRGGREGEGER